jgi:hypothetical protein
VSGKNPRMNPLKSRKQLLIAESELNRAQLIEELQTMVAEVHSLADRARTISSIASATTSLVAGLASFRRKKSAPAAEKTSWWKTILKGAQLAGSLWSEVRPRSRDRNET